LQRPHARAVAKRSSGWTSLGPRLHVALKLLADQCRLGFQSLGRYPGFVLARCRCLGCSPSLPRASSLKFGLAPITIVVPFVPGTGLPCSADGGLTATVSKLAFAPRGLPFSALPADRRMAREGLLDRIVRQLPADVRGLRILGARRQT